MFTCAIQGSAATRQSLDQPSGLGRLRLRPLIPLKDNLPSLRFPVATIALIVVGVVARVLDWSPDLADTWWPLGGARLAVRRRRRCSSWSSTCSSSGCSRRASRTRSAVSRFLLLFLAGGLAAAGAQELVDPDTVVPSVGVAGSIAGLIGAYALLYPHAADPLLGADPVLRHLRRGPGPDPGRGLVRAAGDPGASASRRSRGSPAACCSAWRRSGSSPTVAPPSPPTAREPCTRRRWTPTSGQPCSSAR